MENTPLTTEFKCAADLNVARGIDSLTVVTWGDSIANFIGMNLRHVFNNVINIARNGAGLDNVIPALPIVGIPAGAALIMSMGGNDVEGLIDRPQTDVEDYARRVVSLAVKVREEGAIPVILGHAAPPAPYTGPVPGGVSRWSEPGFLDKWIETMHRMNAAVETAARNANIAWSPVEGRIPRNERALDNLHYTTRGSRRIAQHALADAGIRF